MQFGNVLVSVPGTAGVLGTAPPMLGTAQRPIIFFYLIWQGPFSNCSLGERILNFALG